MLTGSRSKTGGRKPTSDPTFNFPVQKVDREIILKPSLRLLNLEETTTNQSFHLCCMKSKLPFSRLGTTCEGKRGAI